jgi:hypothetical protein
MHVHHKLYNYYQVFGFELKDNILMIFMVVLEKVMCGL